MVALRPVDGDTASAAANDYLARLHQRTDGLDLHNGFGFGRGHAAAPAPACVLHDAVAPAAHLLRLLLSHKGTDGLGGILESRIRRVYLHLGEDGGHGLLDAAVQQFLPQGVLQVIADIPLAHGSADGHGGDGMAVILPGEGGHGDVDHAYLGAVAVGHHHLMALLNQVHDGLGGVLHSDHLLRQVVAQGVAAQGDNDTFAHSWCIPSSQMIVVEPIR